MPAISQRLARYPPTPEADKTWSRSRKLKRTYFLIVWGNNVIFVNLVKGCDSGAVSVIHDPSAIFLLNDDHLVFSSRHDLNTKAPQGHLITEVILSMFILYPTDHHQNPGLGYVSASFMPSVWSNCYSSPGRQQGYPSVHEERKAGLRVGKELVRGQSARASAGVGLSPPAFKTG